MYVCVHLVQFEHFCWKCKFQAPETPIWLLSKHRYNDAENALQWLRGWTSRQAVSVEFNHLKQVSEWSTSCVHCEKQKIKCEHRLPTLFDKLNDMKRKRTIKPFALITISFFLMKFSGVFATRPYLVQILRAHGITMDAHLTTVGLSLFGMAAQIIVLFTVHSLGKRWLYLCSMFGNVLSCFGLALYGYRFFPVGWTSMTTPDVSIQEVTGDYSYFALAMFTSMQFCISLAVALVPCMLMFEVFPFK